MAKTKAVWGIDLGQCALKALRCRAGDEPGQVVAEAFDYIEYPKILSQPEANPGELIAEALGEFLSRNAVKGDRVAISVPGQSGLARFIKLPPVESKKIPDIVKYEARQQIPFALEDVIWDYQQLAGGSEEDGFALETEVGLFAMKREQVYRALEPFTTAGIEVDILQLTPLALYNFVAFDQLPDLPPPDQYDPEDPPESLVVVSLGTETTDLVVTNGYRVWQRSIPLGGSHFTKALTKELKLTFAKAEQAKRNVDQAANRKEVFQAMRPVFNDLITEVQRSINHFKNLDRTAKITRVVALGNAMKLAGLQRYMKQQLELEVSLLGGFRSLSGAGVVDAPVFQDNLLSFASCYGLALQGLGDTKIRTNLIPKEIIRERLIRSKKPWAVGFAATVLLGLSVSALGDWRAWAAVNGGQFDQAEQAARQAANQAQQNQSQVNNAKGTFTQAKLAAEKLVPVDETRLLWPEMLMSVNACLPRDPEGREEPADLREKIVSQNRVYIRALESQRFDNLGLWHTAIREFLPPPAAPGASGAPPVPGAPPPAPPSPAALAAAAPPSGPGWVLELRGYHYHNEDPANERAQFIRNTLIERLSQAEIEVPGRAEPLPVGKLGIKSPVLVSYGETPEKFTDPEAASKPAADGQEAPPPEVEVTRFDFVVQFAWIETPLSKRPTDTPAAPGAPPAGDPSVALGQEP